MKSMCLYETLNIISRHTPAIDWSKEAKRAFEAIRISPTSATITCSMKGNIVEALHGPTAKVCIIPDVTSRKSVRIKSYANLFISKIISSLSSFNPKP